jgi:hypothetical protein
MLIVIDTPTTAQVGMGHAINDDEIRQVRTLLARFSSRDDPVGPDAVYDASGGMTTWLE